VYGVPGPAICLIVVAPSNVREVNILKFLGQSGGSVDVSNEPLSLDFKLPAHEVNNQFAIPKYLQVSYAVDICVSHHQDQGDHLSNVACPSADVGPSGYDVFGFVLWLYNVANARFPGVAFWTAVKKALVLETGFGANSFRVLEFSFPEDNILDQKPVKPFWP